eukprot:Transcript_3779.p1 GENE.Transcript_3779~~Transcript_3779.p1  ORF type:complete len:300 (+),score=52.25 Transcript_3779:785-1684(+)
MRDLCSWMKEVCTEPQALRNADGSPRTVPPADPTFVSGDFGAVAMFDATNTTKERRRWLIERSKETGAKVIFIESILTDEEVITKNILASKVGVKDYTGIDDQQAVSDFRERIAHYERVYETVTEKDLSWIKLIDGGREIACNNIRGFLPTRIMTFLVNLHMQRSPFYFTRHGQSEYNEYGQVPQTRPAAARRLIPSYCLTDRLGKVFTSPPRLRARRPLLRTPAVQLPAPLNPLAACSTPLAARGRRLRSSFGPLHMSLVALASRAATPQLHPELSRSAATPGSRTPANSTRRRLVHG